MAIDTDEELREELGKIHGRLHGRQITHKEVAKHSNWSIEELQHVLIEDEYIFIEEIMRLFKPHMASGTQESTRTAGDNRHKGETE